MLYIKKQMAQLISEQTGQTVEQIESDSDRDRWFSAEEASEYGFVDHVVQLASDVTGKWREPPDGPRSIVRPDRRAATFCPSSASAQQPVSGS